MAERQTAPPSKILRLPELLGCIGLSRSSVYDRMSPSSKRFDPEFPRPIRLGHRSVGWRADEVEQWLRNRERVGEE